MNRAPRFVPTDSRLLGPGPAWPDAAPPCQTRSTGLVVLRGTPSSGPESAVVVFDPSAVVRGDGFAATVAEPLVADMTR